MHNYFKKILAVVVGLTFFVVTASSAYAYVNVKGYYKSNGTYVQPYVRSNPNGIKYDNYSYTPSQGLYNSSYGTKGASWDTPSYITDPNYYTGKSLYENNQNGIGSSSSYITPTYTPTYTTPSYTPTYITPTYTPTYTTPKSCPANAALGTGTKNASSCYCNSGYEPDITKAQCVIADMVLPSSIISLNAQSGNGAVLLSWLPSTDNVGIKDYLVTYDTKPLNQKAGETVEDAPHAKHVLTNSTKIENLINGTTYYFYAIPFDTSGNISNKWSNAVTATPKDDSHPSKVNNITFKKQGNEINFAWDPVTGSSTRYVIFVSNKADDVLNPNEGTTRFYAYKNKFTFSNYLKERTYYFSVYAKSGNLSLSADVISIPGE